MTVAGFSADLIFSALLGIWERCSQVMSPWHNLSPATSSAAAAADARSHPLPIMNRTVLAAPHSDFTV